MLLQETFTYSGKVISKNIYPRKEESQDVWTQNTDLKLFYVSENPKQRKSGKLREREKVCLLERKQASEQSKRCERKYQRWWWENEKAQPYIYTKTLNPQFPSTFQSVITSIFLQSTLLFLSLFLVKLIHTPHFLSLYFYFILLERVCL